MRVVLRKWRCTDKTVGESRGESTGETLGNMRKREVPCHQGGKISKNVVGPDLPKEGDERLLSRTHLECGEESRRSTDPPCLTQCFRREGNALGTILLSWTIYSQHSFTTSPA